MRASFMLLTRQVFVVDDLYFKNILIIVLAKKNYIYIKIF